MKNEAKLKIAKIRKEKYEQELSEQQHQSQQEAEAKQIANKKNFEELAKTLNAGIKELAEALEVNVDFPDIKLLLAKLETLEQLPESFSDIRNLSMAISSKLERLVEQKNAKQVTTVRGFAEANLVFKNIERNTEKFTDLQESLEQLTQTLKQGQQPEDYKPVRLVVGGDGSKLDFLKQMPSARGGGGVSINTEDLAQEDTQLKRLGGDKTAFVFTYTSSGNHDAITPSDPSKIIKIYWVSFLPSPDNALGNLVKVGFGTSGGSIDAGQEAYRSYAVAHWEEFPGAAGKSVIINTETAEKVVGTIHYKEI